MPKKIDVELKARAVRLVSEHRGSVRNLTATAAAVAKQVVKESVRRWVIQAEVDAGDAVLQLGRFAVDLEHPGQPGRASPARTRRSSPGSCWSASKWNHRCTGCVADGLLRYPS
jgi:transposase-like protein